jgi:hypothetical protein
VLENDVFWRASRADWHKARRGEASAREKLTGGGQRGSAGDPAEADETFSEAVWNREEPGTTWGSQG